MSYIIFTLLIIICLIGIFGLFYLNDYFKKIAYLSVSYSAFIVLISYLARKNILIDEIMTIILSIMILFSINILIGIGIAQNIKRNKKNNSNPL